MIYVELVSNGVETKGLGTGHLSRVQNSRPVSTETKRDQPLEKFSFTPSFLANFKLHHCSLPLLFIENNYTDMSSVSSRESLVVKKLREYRVKTSEK